MDFEHIYEGTRTSPRGKVGAEGIPTRSETIETGLEQPSTFPDPISELQEHQNSDSRDRDF